MKTNRLAIRDCLGSQLIMYTSSQYRMLYITTGERQIPFTVKQTKHIQYLLELCFTNRKGSYEIHSHNGPTILISANKHRCLIRVSNRQLSFSYGHITKMIGFFSDLHTQPSLLSNIM